MGPAQTSTLLEPHDFRMAKSVTTSAKRTLARNLKRLRSERELSQQALAAKAGARRALVSEIETCHANPTLETLELIASVMKVKVFDLFSTVA
jgi:transcriptional regulator with XRE-family HTH domain